MVVAVMPAVPMTPAMTMMVVVVMSVARAMLVAVRGGLAVGFSLRGRVRRDRLGRSGLGLLQHRGGL